MSFFRSTPTVGSEDFAGRCPARARNGLGFLLAALCLVGIAPQVAALGLSDVDRLLFPLAGANTGFTNAGPDFDWGVTAENRRLCAGAGVFNATGSCMGLSSYELILTQQLGTVHQNPQARGALPSLTDPFIADSLWTITNASAESFTDPLLLLFTSVNLDPFLGALVPGGYPDLQVGMDGNLLEIARFSHAGMDFFFGSVNVGPLEPGQSAAFLVRYVVSSGPMPIVGEDLVMPPLKVVAMVVPEPTTLVLLVAGFSGLAAFGRRR
jgi:hypothetical protein